MKFNPVRIKKADIHKNKPIKNKTDTITSKKKASSIIFKPTFLFNR